MEGLQAHGQKMTQEIDLKAPYTKEKESRRHLAMHINRGKKETKI